MKNTNTCKIVFNRLSRQPQLSVLVIGCALALLLVGCQTKLQSPQPRQTDRRELTERPANAYLAIPSVMDFLAACDMLARDMVMASVVQMADKPIVLEIKPIENKTGKEMDLTIFPQTIRGMINKQGVYNIIFRDENAREQIFSERVNQSDDLILVNDHSETLTRTKTRTSFHDKYGVGSLPPKQAVDTDSVRQTDRMTEVSSKIADVNYFLNGFIYAVNEMGVGMTDSGYRYFQMQFRLTDSRSGLVVWENMYQIKREGALARSPL